MGRFVSALVQEIWLQVELRGPVNFHEAVQFAEREDVVITCVACHNAQKAAPQKTKWGILATFTSADQDQWREQCARKWRARANGVRNYESPKLDASGI